MSISNLFADNSYKLYCGELDTENLVVDGATFSGNTLVTKGSADVLTANKIMVGDGTNVVKDSLADCDATGNINIPLDQGYYINSQPIVFQDNADSSKYKAELHKVILNDATAQIETSGAFSASVQTDRNHVLSATDQLVVKELNNGATTWDASTAPTLGYYMADKYQGKLEAIVTCDIGTQITIAISDAFSSNVVASLIINGDGTAAQFASTTAFANLPTGVNRSYFEVVASRSGGAGSAIINCVRIMTA